MLKPLEILVGGAGPNDPAAGQPDAIIPSLKGQDLVISWRAADSETGGYLKASEFQVLTAGGFRSLTGNLVAGDYYFIFEGGVKYASGSSSWTNGFNYSQTIAALFGRLGWRQGTITGAPVADGNNATSRSGRYFDDFHPIVSLQNVKQIIEDPAASDAEINAWLDATQRGVILEALNGVINEREILEIGTDFNRYTEANDREIINETNFVGRRITPGKVLELAIQLDAIALYFDGNITFPLYLYQEGKKAPIWTGNVTAVANEKTLVTLPDLVLGYFGVNHIGGAYYLGYFQEDLGSVKAIDESRIDYSPSNCWTIEFIESRRIGSDFDRKIVKGSPWSHGLNLQLSAFKDWTNQIVKKANLFDELIGLQMAAKILERALYAVRSNSTERILKDQLLTLGLFDLSGTNPGVPDAPVTTGIRQKIEREIKRVKKIFFPAPRAVNYETA